MRRQNLSTILEVETPASTRPSEGARDRLSLGSTDSGASYISRKSLDGQFKREPIPEEGRFDSIETQLQKQVGVVVLSCRHYTNQIQNVIKE